MNKKVKNINTPEYREFKRLAMKVLYKYTSSLELLRGLPYVYKMCEVAHATKAITTVLEYLLINDKQSHIWYRSQPNNGQWDVQIRLTFNHMSTKSDKERYYRDRFGVSVKNIVMRLSTMFNNAGEILYYSESYNYLIRPVDDITDRKNRHHKYLYRIDRFNGPIDKCTMRGKTKLGWEWF